MAGRAPERPRAPPPTQWRAAAALTLPLLLAACWLRPRHLRPQRRQAAGPAPAARAVARRRAAGHYRSRQRSHSGAHRAAAIGDAGGRQMARSPAGDPPGAPDPELPERRPVARGQPPPGGGERLRTCSSTFATSSWSSPARASRSTSRPRSFPRPAASPGRKSSPPRRRSLRPRRPMFRRR